MSNSGGIEDGSGKVAEDVAPYPLLVTDILDEEIAFHKVVLCGANVTRKFGITNLSKSKLHITLKSDLGDQIRFKLANGLNEEFSFDTILEDFVLDAQQSQAMVLSFRPDPSLNPHSIDGNKKHISENDFFKQKPHLDVDENLSTFLSTNLPFYPSFDLNGNIFLSAFALHSNTNDADSQSDEIKAVQSQNFVIPFRSTIFRSILSPDVSEIVFDDCTPGGIFVKDFNVWNFSEISCTFRIYIDSTNNDSQYFELSDYDASTPIGRGEIQNCSHKRIRISFKPPLSTIGEFDFVLKIENCLNFSNSYSLPIHCVVNSENYREGIIVKRLGDFGILDFGDCYDGITTQKIISLKNITRKPLVVSLISDSSSKDLIKFDFNIDLYNSDDSSNDLTRNHIFEYEGNYSIDSPNLKNSVDEVFLEQGHQKSLRVLYRPEHEYPDESKAIRFKKNNFHFSLKYGEKDRSANQYSKIIQCKSRSCTSIVRLSATEIHLGDCNIGSVKTCSVEIYNISDLPACINVNVDSTALSILNKHEAILIPPRQTYKLDMQFVPLRVNPSYRKQVKVENLCNTKDNHIFEVKANNMDRHHVLFHSLFYNLQTPSRTNSISFENVIMNNPCVRRLIVENITNKDLELRFSTSLPQFISIYELKGNNSEILEGEATNVVHVIPEETNIDIYESSRRARVAMMNKEKILEVLESSQPKLLNEDGLNSKPMDIPNQRFSYYSSSIKENQNNRMRFSMDLAVTSNNDNRTSVSGSLDSSLSTHLELKKEKESVLPNSFSTSSLSVDPKNLKPMKRVKSSVSLRNEENNEVNEENDSDRSRWFDLYESFENALNDVGKISVGSNVMNSVDAEKKYVEGKMRTRESVIQCIQSSSHPLLHPVKDLTLLPSQKKILYVLLFMNGSNDVSIRGRLKKITAKINVQLISFDKSVLESSDRNSTEFPTSGDYLTREIPAHFKICRSILTLPQKNLSFGHMLTNEHKAKTLILQNASDVPLLYKIRKTGSIASGDLHIIDSRSGVLLPHCNREVNFVFKPSLPGEFKETFTIHNVHDPSNNQIVTLKANISRAETFWIGHTSLDMGSCIAGTWSKPQRLDLINTSKQTREFVLKSSDLADFESSCTLTFGSQTFNLSPRLRFTLEKKPEIFKGELSPGQEALESLERKMVAYEKQGKHEKAEKLRMQIDELRSNLNENFGIDYDGKDDGSEYSVKTGADNVSEENVGLITTDERSGYTEGSTSADKNFKFKSSEGCIHFNVKAGESQTVFISCMANLHEQYSGLKGITGSILVYESKNQDVIKTVVYQAVIYFDSKTFENFKPWDSKELRLPMIKLPSSSASQLSPSVSPESSLPTSPHVFKVPSLSTYSQYTISEILEGKSPHNISPSNAFVSHEREFGNSIQKESANIPLKRSNDVMVTNAWGSEQRVLNWGLTAEISTQSLPTEFVSEGNSSTAGSHPCSHIETENSNPLFSIELPGVDFPRVPSIPDAVGGEFDDWNLEPYLDLSSAAAMARSLSSWMMEKDYFHSYRPVSIGDIILKNSFEEDALENTFSIKSLCSHDIHIYILVEFQKNVQNLEMWALNGSQLKTDVNRDRDALQASSTDNGLKLEFHPMEEFFSQFSDEDTLTFNDNFSKYSAATSIVLSANSYSKILLRIPDKDINFFPSLYDKSNLSSSNPNTVFSRNLSLKTDEAIRTHSACKLAICSPSLERNRIELISVSFEPPERLLKVTPDEIFFPPANLIEEVNFNLTIQNRCGFKVSYSISSISQLEGKEFLNQLSSDSSANSMRQDQATSNSEESFEFESLIFSDPYPTKPKHTNPDRILVVDTPSGTLNPWEIIKLNVKCHPIKPGKQFHSLYVKSSACLHEKCIAVHLHPQKLTCLRFPDLKEGEIFDLGYFFLNDSSMVKTSPLHIQNILEIPIHVSFKSNLPKQVSITADEDGLTKIEDISLKDLETVVVYVCLKPSVEASLYENGQCREMIGGLRIHPHLLTPQDLTSPEIRLYKDDSPFENFTVKFRALVGLSLMEVSTEFINLGRVKEGNGFISGNFSIQNPSMQMPLRASISAISSVIEPREVYLGFHELESSECNESSTEASVKFHLPITMHGIIQDCITVENLMFPQMKKRVFVQVFFNDSSISVYPGVVNKRYVKRDTKNPINMSSTQSYPEENSQIIKDEEFLDIAIEPGEKLTSNEADERNCIEIIEVDSISDEKNELNFCSTNLDEIMIHSFTNKQQNLLLFEISDTRHHIACFVIKNRTSDCIRFQAYSSIPIFIFNETILEKMTLVDENSSSSSSHVPSKSSMAPMSILSQSLASTLSSTSDLTSSSLQFLSSSSSHSTTASNVMSTSKSDNGSMNAPEIDSIEDNLNFPSFYSDAYIPCSEVFSLPPDSCSRYFICFKSEKCFINDLDIQSIINFSGYPFKSKILLQKMGENFDCRMNHSISEMWINEYKHSDPLMVNSDFINLKTLPGETMTMIDLNGRFCISEGQIMDRKIDLGKFTSIHNLADQSFSFHVKNIGNSELIFKISNIPELFELKLSENSVWPTNFLHGEYPKRLLEDTSFCYVAKVCEIVEIEFTFKASFLSSSDNGLKTWNLKIENLENLNNQMELEIVADIEFPLLRFPDTFDGSILLPPIPLLLQTTQHSQLLEIQNLSENHLEFLIQVKIEIHLQKLISIELHFDSKNKNQLLKLKPKENLSSILHLQTLLDNEEFFKSTEKNLSKPLPKPPITEVGLNQILSMNEYKSLDEDFLLANLLCVGHVYVSCAQFNHQIPILTLLLNGQNESKIEKESFHLSASAVSSSSSSSLSILPPHTFSTSRINPENMTPQTESTFYQINQLPKSNVSLHQLQHPNKLQEQGRSKSHHLDSNFSPRILLKGCTHVKDSDMCYELNLGKQNISNHGLNWELVLINASDNEKDELEFALYTLDLDDSKWLSISTLSGKLLSRQQEIIRLTFSTKCIGIFSTYLLIENSNRVDDLKSVRINLEVVAPRNALPNSNTKNIFSVFLNENGCRNDRHSMDFGDIYYHFSYFHHSFVIQNHYSKPTKFVLSSEFQKTSSSNIKFSLSATSQKFLNSIVIDGHSRIRIWVHFFPKCTMSSTYNDEDDGCEVLNASIFVNCRLVKDYQFIIPLTAKCHHPQILLSNSNSKFNFEFCISQKSTTNSDPIQSNHQFNFISPLSHIPPYHFFPLVHLFPSNDLGVSQFFSNNSYLEPELLNNCGENEYLGGDAAKCNEKEWCNGIAIENESEYGSFEKSKDEGCKKNVTNFEYPNDFASPSYSVTSPKSLSSTFSPTTPSLSSSISSSSMSSSSFFQSLTSSSTLSSSFSSISLSSLSSSSTFFTSSTSSSSSSPSSSTTTSHSKSMHKISEYSGSNELYFSPREYPLYILNSKPSLPLQYVIKNQSVFFEIFSSSPTVTQDIGLKNESEMRNNSAQNDEKEINSHTFHSITIRLNVENVLKHIDAIKNYKLVEEHFSIYNKTDPKEKYLVHLYINCSLNYDRKNERCLFRSEEQIKNLEIHSTIYINHFNRFTKQFSVFLVSNENSVTSDQASSLAVPTFSPFFDLNKLEGFSSHLFLFEIDSNDHLIHLDRMLKEFCHHHVAYTSLLVDFHYISDELIYYLLQVIQDDAIIPNERLPFSLAKLFFTVIFQSQLFKTCIQACEFYAQSMRKKKGAKEEVINDDSEPKEKPPSSIFSRNDEDTDENHDNKSKSLPPPSNFYCSQFLKSWSFNLNRFLSYFPDTHKELNCLREKNAEIQKAIQLS